MNYAAELAKSVDATDVDEFRNEYHVIADVSLNRKDEVEDSWSTKELRKSQNYWSRMTFST